MVFIVDLNESYVHHHDRFNRQVQAFFKIVGQRLRPEPDQGCANKKAGILGQPAEGIVERFRIRADDEKHQHQNGQRGHQNGEALRDSIQDGQTSRNHGDPQPVKRLFGRADPPVAALHHFNLER